MEKPAPAEHPVFDLVTRRWSPRAYSDRKLESGMLRTILEAARWAPSSNNEQPWRFIVATKDNPAEFARMLPILVEGNQRWAKDAAVLMISVATMNWTRNDKPNRHAYHDVGLATEHILLQCTALGLQGHPMAGFDPEKARQTYNIPAGYEAVAMIAIGFPADIATLPEEIRQKEMSPRVRKPQSEFVFNGNWGEALK